MDRRTFAGKSVLITGASSGIGAELARQLGQAGACLTLTGRRADLLRALAQRITDGGECCRAHIVYRENAS
jgi:NADP-dependent 3-hydroxy acid dehydrogenase YdfG